MKQLNYSVYIHWDKRYPKAGTDKCPVQLGVTINGVQFKVGLQLYASKNDFDKAMSGKSGNAEVKELRSQIATFLTKAEGLLERLPNPTKDTFLRLFRSETDLFKGNKTDASVLFNDYIKELKKEERIGSAKNYALALNSLKAFRKELYLEDIDESFLKGYSSWMKEIGNSVTTVQIYLRSLRAIFNKAIKDGFVAERFYPFDDYSIGTSEKSKEVLYPEQVKLLYEFQSKNLVERRAKDYWLFCYLSNGINPKDMAYLKMGNIQGDYIVFVREKTKRTNRVANKEIKVYLHTEMQRIIREWGTQTEDKEAFVFPIINAEKHVTAIQKEQRRKEVQKKVNKALKRIGEQLGFSNPLVLNLARHSFGTNLKIQGTPTEHIRDMLGHSSVTTTAHYLKSLPDTQIKELSDKLLNF